jgi:plastocyanin
MRPLTLLAATTVALLACGGDDGSNGPNPPSGDITVGNNFFNPSTFNATAGQTVTWAWADGAVTHNIVFVDGAPGSGNLSSGTFQRTFSTAGTYNYFCSIHGASVMSGVVNVAAGSTGDAGGSTGGGSSGGGTGGSGMGGGGYGGANPY